jgi:hypothetical protein
VVVLNHSQRWLKGGVSLPTSRVLLRLAPLLLLEATLFGVWLGLGWGARAATEDTAGIGDVEVVRCQAEDVAGEVRAPAATLPAISSSLAPTSPRSAAQTLC